MAKGVAPMVGVAHLEKFRSLRRYDGVAALNSGAVGKARGDGVAASRVAVVENTANVERRDALRPAFRSPPVIGAMGRLDAGKNFSVFIRALGRLRERGVDFRAVLAGSGSEESALRAEAEAAGLAGRLEFLGYVGAVEAFFDSIDIFCCPSSFESFGLTMLEAMAMNVPVVASDIPSFRLIMDAGGCGVLFPAGSSDSLADALLSFVDDPENARRLGMLGGERYERLYSPERMYEKLESLVAVVVGGGLG